MNAHWFIVDFIIFFQKTNQRKKYFTKLEKISIKFDFFNFILYSLIRPNKSINEYLKILFLQRIN